MKPWGSGCWFCFTFFFFFLDCEVEEDGGFFVWDMVWNVEEGPMSEMDLVQSSSAALVL